MLTYNIIIILLSHGAVEAELKQVDRMFCTIKGGPSGPPLLFWDFIPRLVPVSNKVFMLFYCCIPSKVHINFVSIPMRSL